MDRQEAEMNNLGMSEEALAEGQQVFAAGTRAKPRIR